MKCPTCGEYNGETRWENLTWLGPCHDGRPGDIVRVKCLCNGVLCRGCGKNKVHASGSNSYDKATNTIDHWPWFAGLAPCWECAEENGVSNRGLDVKRYNRANCPDAPGEAGETSQPRWAAAAGRVGPSARLGFTGSGFGAGAVVLYPPTCPKALSANVVGVLHRQRRSPSGKAARP